MRYLALIFCSFLVLASANGAMALTLDFEDQNNLGVTLADRAEWSNVGGGHIYLGNSMANMLLYFDSPVFLDSFEMNGKPWEGFTSSMEVIDLVNVAVYDSLMNELWSELIDLSSYNTWDNWLSVDVARANVSSLTVYGTSTGKSDPGFWPSIDNVLLTDGHTVPEPGTVLLVGIGLVGLVGLRARIKN